MTSQNTPIELFKALANAKKSMPVIGKKGKNEKQDFDYAKYEDIAKIVDPTLSDHGLMILANTLSSETSTYQSAKSIHHTSHIKVEYVVVHLDSGETWSCEIHSSGMDSGDKSMTKAYTYARKTMLLQLLGLRVGDPDPDGETLDTGTFQDNADHMAAEATRGYQETLGVISTGTPDEGREAVNRFYGWAKNAGRRLPRQAMHLTVIQRVGGEDWSGTCQEYVAYLKKLLVDRVQSSGGAA